MATYNPKALVPVTQLTATAGTSVYTQPASTTSILRTIHLSCAAAGHTATVSLGADAAATRILAAYPLSANSPAILNGWWVINSGAGGAHAIDANADAITQVNLLISGYEYA